MNARTTFDKGAPSPPPPPSRYSIGIDLGTTHSGLAYVDTRAPVDPVPEARMFAIPQLVAPALVEARELLPSVIYFPAGPELPPDSTALPWAPSPSPTASISGLLARTLGARAPGRAVVSAKSWLCHPDVDRRSPILPWASTDGTGRISPLDAQAQLLDHMRQAWNHRMGQGTGARMEDQDVLLAVPASFDAVARQLTQEAAQRAGLKQVTLIEEPQVAFYCWLAIHKSNWWNALGRARTVLVCDVGGGTSDFTLIAIKPRADRDTPEPIRVAVGDHLLLGGDNFDLALAHRMEPLLSPRDKLPPWEWGELVLACREAKELLLAEGAPVRTTVTVLGRSSRVVGGARRAPLERAQVEDTVLNGFFPTCAPEDSPSLDRTGLRELGLPYVADPAVTRHLAEFLRHSREAMDSALGTAAEAARPTANASARLARPDVVLFNGGVFRPRIVRERLLSVIRSWFPSDDGWVLDGIVNDEPDLAVARGAAYYGLVRRGHGLRISGGSARSYYVGMGARGKGGVTHVCCVVPRGMEEGEQHVVADGGTGAGAGTGLELVVGQAVKFPLYCASTRPHDAAGQILPADVPGLLALPGLRTVLDGKGSRARPGTGGSGSGRGREHGDAAADMGAGEGPAGGLVKVGLVARLTPTGTLELACEDLGSQRTWELSFELRATDTRKHVSGSASTPSEGPARGQHSQAALEGAGGLVRAVFASTPGTGLSRDPISLRKRLEEMLATNRERWNLHTLRTLLGSLLEVSAGRLCSPAHEFAWLNLTGYCARPGYGHPLDVARLSALWGLYPAGVRFRREEMNHRAWWTLWRRVSAGLDQAEQEHLFARLRPLVLGEPAARRHEAPAADRPGVIEEAWRMVASLERIAPDSKVPLGDRLATVLGARASTPWALWALARIGARAPLTGALANVVSPTVAARWLTPLARQLKARNDPITFCLAQLARRTGDRVRDLDEPLRADLERRLRAVGAPTRHVELVRSVVDLAGAEQDTLMGDALPPGLIHSGTPAV